MLSKVKKTLAVEKVAAVKIRLSLINLLRNTTIKPKTCEEKVFEYCRVFCYVQQQGAVVNSDSRL